MDEFGAWFVNNMLIEARIDEDDIPRRQARSRVDPFDLRDAEFVKNFRLSKELAINLINILEPLIPTKEIETKIKVLCALNFLRTGSYQTPVGNSVMINLSQPSVSRCIEEVVEALNEPGVFNEWVHFPRTIQEMNTIVAEFYEMFEFPGILGVLDCTHVAIVPPTARRFDERSYMNRKNFHSINAQIICDAHLKILNVNSRFPGSSHDAHIWNNSNVKTLLERNEHNTNYHLIADSGYALRPWCLIPIPEAVEGTPESKYNTAFKKARCSIERCNGVLKSRFRCLTKARMLHYTPNKASKIINASTVLHNMCINARLEEPELIEEGNIHIEYIEPYIRGRVDPLLQLGRIKQANIVRNYFQ